MPGLRCYGRKWLIAEDDVPLPAFIMCIFHLVWIGPMISYYVITYDTVHCKNVGRTSLAVSGLLFGFLCSIISEIACLVIGLRGTMFERSKRKSLPYFVYLNTFAHVIQVIFNGYLTYLIYHDFNLDCDSRGGVWAPDGFLLALNIAEWIYIFIMILFLLFIFNPHGVFSDPVAWERHYTWIMWLGICCWNPLSARERQMQKERAKRVGANLCALFGHVDITITDAWAAFIVARTLYKQKVASKNMNNETTTTAEAKVGEKNLEKEGITSTTAISQDINNTTNISSSTTKDLLIPPQIQEINKTNNNNFSPSPPSTQPLLPLPEPGTPVDHATLVEAQHFFNYALATYGWMLYIFDNGLSAIGELACGCSPLGWHGRIAPCGLGQVNTHVAMKTLHVPKSDILFLREEGALPDVVSYIIAVDHSTESVVVAVRGALAIMDNVRDLLFEAAELDPWLETPWSWDTVPPPAPQAKMPTTTENNDENNKNDTAPRQKFLAQGDYLNVAYQTLADILRIGVLKTAISGANSQFPGYKLVLTGHSLGAAVSYLIALRLRLAIPDLKCWAFSPPLGLISASLGASSTDWCTAVVCGKELPPRYSVDTLDRALQDALQAAVQCRVPKLRILTGWLGGTAALNNPNESLLWKDDEIPEEVQQILDQATASLDANEHRKYLLATAGTFGLPGRVFHLQLVAKHIKPKKKMCGCGGSSSSSCCGSPGVQPQKRRLPEREYQAVWIDAGDLAKEGLQMSGRVISDHMPDFIAGVLRQVALVDEEKEGETSHRVGTGTVVAAAVVEGDKGAVDVEGGNK